MARVLHLLERQPDYQTQTAVSQLTRDSTADALRTVGRGGDYSTVFNGVLRLRKCAQPFDFIHAWGAPALNLAVLGCSKRIIYTPTHFPARHDIRWLRAVMGAHHIEVVCPSNTMRRFMVEHGVAMERCHLIRPGVEFARVSRRRNDELRAELRFEPQAHIILACGECVRGSNQNDTVLATTVLNMYDPKHKVLLWGRGPLNDAAKRFASLMLPRNFIRFATDWLGKDVTFEQCLSVADAMMITAHGPIPSLPIAACMAAGLPIVAVVTPTVAELLEDQHNALMLNEARSRLLARRVLELEDDPQLRWRISDAARTDAYEYFTMTRFVSQFRALYEQFAAEKPIEVPQMAPGAGARFSGR